MASKAIKNAYKTSGNSEETKKVSIKPSSLGLMGPMFKSINLGVTIIAQATGYQDDIILVPERLNYLSLRLIYHRGY